MRWDPDEIGPIQVLKRDTDTSINYYQCYLFEIFCLLQCVDIDERNQLVTYRDNNFYRAHSSGNERR